MRRATIQLLLLMALPPLLSACAPVSTSTRNASGLDAGVAAVMGGQAGASIGSSASASKAKANVQRAACGTPTQWTPLQARDVSSVMLANQNDPGMQILAPEWERLDNQVRTCRGEKSRT